MQALASRRAPVMCRSVPVDISIPFVVTEYNGLCHFSPSRLSGEVALVTPLLFESRRGRESSCSSARKRLSTTCFRGVSNGLLLSLGFAFMQSYRSPPAAERVR